MRYLFKSTYTPNDPESERQRKRTVVGSLPGRVGSPERQPAIKTALSNLEMGGLVDEAIAEYQDSVRDEDASEGWAWEVGTNSGLYHFEIEPFEVTDPINKAAILAWAQTEADARNHKSAARLTIPVEPLICIDNILSEVLGRWTWRCLGNEGAFELRQQLHDIALNGLKGCTVKPYNDMSPDELAEEVMETIVPNQDKYEEAESGEPFGMAIMVMNDPQLWEGAEHADRRIE